MVSIDAKMWSPEAGKKSYKKNLKSNGIDLHISPLCLRGQFLPFWACGDILLT